MNLEKELAELHELVPSIDQEIVSITEKLSMHSGGEDKDIFERQLRRAKQRAEMLQKRIELTQRQLDLTHSKDELAQREQLAAHCRVEMLEARAQTIRDTRWPESRRHEGRARAGGSRPEDCRNRKTGGPTAAGRSSAGTRQSATGPRAGKNCPRTGENA